MGVIILTILIALALLGLGLVLRHFDEWSLWDGFVAASIFVFIAASIMIADAAFSNVYKDVTFEEYKMKYNTLTHQLKDDYYNTDFYDGRKALINDILEYNTTVIRGRAKHNSAWIGCFYPEDWESLPLIELGSEGEE
jgi:hypothetical protein